MIKKIIQRKTWEKWNKENNKGNMFVAFPNFCQKEIIKKNNVNEKIIYKCILCDFIIHGYRGNIGISSKTKMKRQKCV